MLGFILHLQDLNTATNVPAKGLVPDGARPSVDRLSADYKDRHDLFFFFLSLSQNLNLVCK